MSNVQKDMALIQAEFLVLKNDNTELLHAQNDLKHRYQSILQDNGRLEEELSLMKTMINRLIQSKILAHEGVVEEPQTNKSSWILIPDTKRMNDANDS